MTITKITATRLYMRNGDLKGWRYDAHLEDGTVQVARACATRLYVNAYQYKDEVNGSGKSGLAPYVLFGKRAYPGAGQPIATYVVEPTDPRRGVA